MSDRDLLASSLADSLNHEFKSSNNKVAFFLTENVSVNVTDYVSSGSSTLDLAISNRPHGGFPVGRIVELIGLEATGKSLVASHTLANTQKKGGVAIYIDTESAVSRDYLEAIGVNLNDLVYIKLEQIEDVFEVIEKLIVKIRELDKNKEKIVTIVVDSIAAATDKGETEKEYDRGGWNTTKSIVMSMGMRKITNLISNEKILLVFTNQLRTNLNITFGDPYTTPGGKALGFHASVRIRLKAVEKLKAKNPATDKEEIIGMRIRAQAIKNRIGPPQREAIFNVYFNSGIRDDESWLEALIDFKIVTKSGAWYSYTDEDTGEIIKFQKATFVEKILSDATRKDKIYNKLCDAYIINYQSRSDLVETEADSSTDQENIIENED